MPRPAVTKGDVQRLVAGALAGGLPPGSFEVRLEGGRVRLLPCTPIAPQAPDGDNPWDRIAPPS